MITNVKFLGVVAIGVDSTPETFIEQNQILLGFRLSITLDTDDNRFLRVVGSHIDGRPSFTQYIPLTAVGTILTDAHGLQRTASVAKKA